MADKPSLNDTRAFLAAELKKTLADHTARIEDIRAREQKAVAKRASKLAKAEKTCKGCGKKFDSVSATPSEYCGGCNRKPKDAEGKVRKGGDLMTSPDSGAPTSMGMSEKMGKNSQAGEAPGGGDMALSEMCKGCGRPGGLCKCGTCKSELGKSDDKMSTLFGKDPKKSVMPKGARKGKDVGARAGGGGVCSECGESGHGPSKHMKKDEKSVATANKELGGFKSLAASPAMPMKTKPGVKPGAPVGKKELPAVKAVPAKKTPGAKLPGMPKKVDTTEGSGGDVKKGLKKGAMDVALGMQKPVASDPLAHTKLALPGMGPKRPPPVPKVNGMHPNTAQGLHAVGVGMNPETRAGLAALPRPSAVSQGGMGVPGKQPAGMGGGDAHKIAAVPPPIPAAARKDEADMQHGFTRPTDMVGRKHPIDAGGWPAGTESWADRSPAIRAAKAKAPAAEPSYAPGSGTGPVRQQRSPYAGVRGMAALARGEKPAVKPKQTLAVKPLARGLSMTNHNRTLLGKGV